MRLSYIDYNAATDPNLESFFTGCATYSTVKAQQPGLTTMASIFRLCSGKPGDVDTMYRVPQRPSQQLRFYLQAAIILELMMPCQCQQFALTIGTTPVLPVSPHRRYNNAFDHNTANFFNGCPPRWPVSAVMPMVCWHFYPYNGFAICPVWTSGITPVAQHWACLPVCDAIRRHQVGLQRLLLSIIITS